MIKQLFLFVNIISIFFYQLFFLSEVTVKQALPPTIAPNGEIVVTFTISKADVTGFAKLQQTIPNGFTVESVESKGATFSFKDQIVKYIWMSLPTENEFTISYKLKNQGKDAGKFTLEGRFSYLADSERKNIDIPTATFMVDENATPTETASNEEPINNSEEPSETIREINVTRRIEKLTETKFKVELTFTKKNVDGFAKLTETIPDGFTATQDKVQGAVFSIEKNAVKLLWLSIPTENEFVASYFIETKSAQGEQTIKGTLSYLDVDDTKKVITIAPTNFEVLAGKEEIANTEETANQQETSLQEKINNKVDNSSNNNEEKTENEIKKEAAKVTNTPAPETGIAYKIQVGAFRENISIDKFKKKYKLNDKIELENHEGWSKLITGSFNEYKSARNKRNSVRTNVKTAFVTAYNKGSRITVQEALMISNQKWVN